MNCIPLIRVARKVSLEALNRMVIRRWISPWVRCSSAVQRLRCLSAIGTVLLLLPAGCSRPSAPATIYELLDAFPSSVKREWVVDRLDVPAFRHADIQEAAGIRYRDVTVEVYHAGDPRTWKALIGLIGIIAPSLPGEASLDRGRPAAVIAHAPFVLGFNGEEESVGRVETDFRRVMEDLPAYTW